MKRLTISLLIGGLALMVWLIIEVGAPMIGAALSTAGWGGLLAICLFHLIATALMGLAWWRLQRLGKLWIFIWGRLVRDAGSEVLPLSQIGGYVLGARAVIIHGVAGIAVTAATVVDATLEFTAQITYSTFGLVLFVWLSPSSAIASFVLALLGVATAAAAAFIVLQRRGSDLPARLAQQLSGSFLGRLFGSTVAVQAEITELLRLERVWVSYFCHLGAWIVSGVEAWLALWLMGASLSLPTVLAIESLVYATRAMAFMVPNAIGVQEGAYIVLGGAFGLTPEFALSLSLLKRARDFALGIAALASWQVWEGRKQWGTRTLLMLTTPSGPHAPKDG